MRSYGPVVHSNGRQGLLDERHAPAGSTRRRRLGYGISATALLLSPGLGALFLLWASGNWSCGDAIDAPADCDEQSASFLRLIEVLGIGLVVMMLSGLLIIVSARSLPWPDETDNRPVRGSNTVLLGSLSLALFAFSFQITIPRSIWLYDFLWNGEPGELVWHGGGALALLIAWTVWSDLRFWGASRGAIRRAGAALVISGCATFLPGTAIAMVWWWVRRRPEGPDRALSD